VDFIPRLVERLDLFRRSLGVVPWAELVATVQGMERDDELKRDLGLYFQHAAMTGAPKISRMGCESPLRRLAARYGMSVSTVIRRAQNTPRVIAHYALTGVFVRTVEHDL